jgi:hypothetical protein
MQSYYGRHPGKGLDMGRITIVLITALLTGCDSGATGGSGSSPADLNSMIDQRCDSLAQPGATIAFSSVGCPDCSAADEQNAIDGRDSTFANLTAPVASTGQMALLAAAPTGVSYPSGSNAVLTLSVGPSSGLHLGGTGTVGTSNRHDWHVTVRTYLAGALQEQDDGFVRVSSDGDSDRYVVGVTTTKAFDSVEGVFDRPPDAEHAMGNVSGAGYAAESGDVRVHEVCSDFDLSGLDVD